MKDLLDRVLEAILDSFGTNGFDVFTNKFGLCGI